MRMGWNLPVAAICRASRKGFSSDALNLDKNAQQGEFVHKVNLCLGMVVMRRKDSKVFQTISTMMEKGKTNIQQWTGQDVHSLVIQMEVPKRYQRIFSA
eukprot:1291988-Ditylum_brightwellii.AAC.1